MVFQMKWWGRKAALSPVLQRADEHFNSTEAGEHFNLNNKDSDGQ